MLSITRDEPIVNIRDIGPIAVMWADGDLSFIPCLKPSNEATKIMGYQKNGVGNYLADLWLMSEEPMGDVCLSRGQTLGLVISSKAFISSTLLWVWWRSIPIKGMKLTKVGLWYSLNRKR